MNSLAKRLRQRTGLDASTLGPGVLERVITSQMRTLGLNQLAEYERVLDQSPAHWTELVEALLILETWFFRDAAAFDALKRLVMQEWLPNHQEGKLRLLSLPSSTGEEPYSIVMTLLDAGLPKDRFQVDAADVSGRALAHARRATYRNNSFRGPNLQFRNRYFQVNREGYVLDPGVATCVHFRQANLIADDFKTENDSYDFIFCRNLLIYFDRVNQQTALARLGAMLAASGVLFLGPAEKALALANGYVSVQPPLTFGCRKASGPPELEASEIAQTYRTESLPARGKGTRLSELPPDWAGGAAGMPGEVAAALRLVTAGRFTEAAALCEAHLAHSWASAAAYYVLGVARDAGGDARAIDCYRKALYLQPNHYESLVRMAALAQKSGDVAGAQNFRRRVQRLRSHGQMQS
jgi:chemotaxis protein methyltransferase WspC